MIQGLSNENVKELIVVLQKKNREGKIKNAKYSQIFSSKTLKYILLVVLKNENKN